MRCFRRVFQDQEGVGAGRTLILARSDESLSRINKRIDPPLVSPDLGKRVAGWTRLPPVYSRRSMSILLSITLFVLFGAAFVAANLLAGKLARPRLPNSEKLAVYECGEPTIGSGWVQFDLRFYIVALVYLVFDVEVSLFYPWAVAYGSATELAAEIGGGMTAVALRAAALVDMLVFFAILLVGFAYLWRFGYLDWIRSAATTSLKALHRPSGELSQQMRRDEPT